MSEAGETRDTLPQDLDASFVGPYRFPDNARRRITGTLYLLAGAALIVIALTADTDAVLVNAGIPTLGVVLIVLAAYHWIVGRRFGLDEDAALAAASVEVGFEVGYASTQLGWRGILSRPTWRTLVFSGEHPPRQRSLVLIDAIDGTILERLTEDVPEDERNNWPSEEELREMTSRSDV